MAYIETRTNKVIKCEIFIILNNKKMRNIPIIILIKNPLKAKFN